MSKAFRINRRHTRTDNGRKRLWVYACVILAVILMGSGAYVLLLLASPAKLPLIKQTWNKPVPHAKVELTEDRLYIPKLKLNLPMKTGGESALLGGLWHRFPERGDPKQGGNFILAGHRFDMGLTPSETKLKSPLYHVDALVQGDPLYVDFGGVRYRYTVTDRLKVKPDDVAIEESSDVPKMTLYTCTFQGSADGREVVIAHMSEKDIDPAKPLPDEGS